MKEVLVLGGGGFIGRNIVNYLVDRGDCNVTAADIKEGSNWYEISNDDHKCDRFKAVIADFTDISAFKDEITFLCFSFNTLMLDWHSFKSDKRTLRKQTNTK